MYLLKRITKLEDKAIAMRDAWLEGYFAGIKAKSDYDTAYNLKWKESTAEEVEKLYRKLLYPRSKWDYALKYISKAYKRETWRDRQRAKGNF